MCDVTSLDSNPLSPSSVCLSASLSVSLLVARSAWSCFLVSFDWKPWPTPCSWAGIVLLARLTPHHLISMKAHLERTQHITNKKPDCAGVSATPQSASGPCRASECPMRSVGSGRCMCIHYSACRANHHQREFQIEEANALERLMNFFFMR